jgi:DNA polymerase III epsilon subunit-like protein
VLNYTAIDFETANSYRGSPCSVGLVRVRDGQVVDERHWLIRPPEGADWFAPWNVSIHGITSDMVATAPRWRDVLSHLIDFIGDDVVVAHNAGFDIGVIRYACAVDNIEWPEMRFLCTLVMARRALALPTYRLPYVAETLGYALQDHHDALEDARAVVHVVNGLADRLGADSIDGLASAVGMYVGRMSSGIYKGSVALSGTAALVRSDVNADADASGYLYDRVVVFTGTLMSMTRQVAWDECSRVGAVAEKGVTKRTHVLVVGDINPAVLRPGSEVTGRARKAFELQDGGQPIEVMTEDDFLRCLEGKPLDGPDALLTESPAVGAGATTRAPLRSIPLSERPKPKAPKPPKPLRRTPVPTDQECSVDGCTDSAAFKTRTKPTWCRTHIEVIQGSGGLRALESFTHPDDWQLTECLSCGVTAHYRFNYTLEKNGCGEATCRACYWRQWAKESRAMQGGWANMEPVTYNDAKAIAEDNGYEYLGPLTAPSYRDDPHHTRCRKCSKVSAERLGDIAFGCTCQPK